VEEPIFHSLSLGWQCFYPIYFYIFLYSIQNLNKDASTDTSFKTYTEPQATHFEHETGSHACGEGTAFSDPVPGPSGVTTENSDFFAPIIYEEESQEETFNLPQVII